MGNINLLKIACDAFYKEAAGRQDRRKRTTQKIKDLDGRLARNKRILEELHEVSATDVTPEDKADSASAIERTNKRIDRLGRNKAKREKFLGMLPPPESNIQVVNEPRNNTGSQSTGSQSTGNKYTHYADGKPRFTAKGVAKGLGGAALIGGAAYGAYKALNKEDNTKMASLYAQYMEKRAADTSDDTTMLGGAVGAVGGAGLAHHLNKPVEKELKDFLQFKQEAYNMGIRGYGIDQKMHSLDTGIRSRLKSKAGWGLAGGLAGAGLGMYLDRNVMNANRQEPINLR